MCDYIKELFDRELDFNRLNFHEAEAYDILDMELNRCQNKISELLGSRAYNDYLNVYIQHSQLENIACFRHGFRLAVRLMLGV